MEDKDFWFCRTFENFTKKINFVGFQSTFKLGYMSIGWGSRMFDMDVINFPFIDDQDLEVCVN